jgi:hypothetical protein
MPQLGALLLEPLVRRNGPVGERDPAPLAAPDHPSDGVVEKSAGNSRIFNLAGTFKIVPGNLSSLSRPATVPFFYPQKLSRTTFAGVSSCFTGDLPIEQPSLPVAQSAS